MALVHVVSLLVMKKKFNDSGLITFIRGQFYGNAVLDEPQNRKNFKYYHHPNLIHTSTVPHFEHNLQKLHRFSCVVFTVEPLLSLKYQIIS